jgi:hypothetical protein
MMRYWRRHWRLRQVIGLTLVVLTPGCTSWRASDRPVPQCLAEEKPELVRVVFAQTRETLVLRRPSLVTDSLVGVDSVKKRVAVPLTDIAALELRRTDAGKTVALVGTVTILLVAVAAAAAAIALSESSMGMSCSESSCPWIYAWDGRSWQLESGTFGGAITRGAARTDLDNLNSAVVEHGKLRLKLANQLNETDYIDEVSVLAVDHGPGLTILPATTGRPVSVLAPQPPRQARDDRGTDVLPAVRQTDGWQWESNPTGRDSSRIGDLRDGLTLTFARPPGARRAKLVLDARNSYWAALMLERFLALHGPGLEAWYDSLDTNPVMRRDILNRLAEEGFLHVSIWDGTDWQRQGTVWEVGPELSKRQVVPLDLRDLEGDSVRVRLESAPSFWAIDAVAMDYSDDARLTIRHVRPSRATTHNGGNALGVLSDRDDRTLTLERTQWAELEFRVPDPPVAEVRTWMVESTGWYRIHLTPARIVRSDLLNAIETDRLMGAKLSVAWMNQIIRTMARQESQP